MLFLPAISFRLAINRLENLKGLLLTLSITDSVWTFTVVPIVIHMFLITALRFLHFVIKLDLLLNITYSNAKFPLHNNLLGRDLINFLGYNLLAIAIGFVSGLLTNMIERRWNLISHLLGRGNEWYEAFEADILKIRGETKIRNVDLVYLDVLVTTKESSVLYSGFLAKYYFKPRSTELDYLVLRRAKKRDLRKLYSTDNPHIRAGKSNFYDPDTGAPYRIQGDYLILPMKEVININITYFYLDDLFERADRQAA